MIRLIIYIIIATFVSLNVAFAQSDSPGVGFKSTGQSSMNFLEVSVVPKATALGNAYSAVGKGVESIFYNPAGLAESSNKTEVFFSVTNWIADINYMAAAASYNLENIGTVGISFLNVDYGDIIGTRLISGTSATTHELGYEETGTVSNVGAYAFGLAYAREVTDVFLFGAGVRLVGQQLGQSLLSNGMTDNNMLQVALDLGVKYYTPIQGFRFAMSIRNFANSIKYEEVSSSLPLTFAVGGAIDLFEMYYGSKDDVHSLLATAEFSHPNNYTERVHLGLDYSMEKLFSIRAGYVTNHDIAGLSLGLGLAHEIMGTNAELSYSFSSMEVFDSVNRFSFKLGF